MKPITNTPLDRRPTRVAARVALVLMVTALLAGCGKKGAPIPPPDEPNTYPRPYPSE
jgi:predicted small lipoprotein YifL